MKLATVIGMAIIIIISILCNIASYGIIKDQETLIRSYQQANEEFITKMDKAFARWEKEDAL